MQYMRQLDSLRAFAVIAVLYTHFYGVKSTPFPFFKKTMPWGALGVELFFVLSGFLITGILLQSKDLINDKAQSIYQSAKQFYIRRTLRIFPIYYFTLIAAALLSVGQVRETFIWHFGYLSNVYMVKVGHWLGVSGHLWSLSVEEQFYLFWVWFIFLVPQKHLLKAVLILISIGPIFRYLSSPYLDNAEFPGSFLLLFGCLDLLGVGALLAILKHDPVKYLNLKKSICKLGLVVGGLFFACILIDGLLGTNSKLQLFRRTFEALFLLWLIDRASDGFKGIAGKMLDSKVLVYLGKISYGIYLYHNFMPTIIHKVLASCQISYPQSITIDALLCTVSTLLISILSWHMIEKPINNLKKRFSYKTTTKLPLPEEICFVQKSEIWRRDRTQ